MNIGIILQGPTEYCHPVAEFYSQFDNVVWSTWKDEPKENIDFIFQKGIDVILNDKPEYGGYLNINLQCISTLEGIKYFQAKGFTEVIKVRSDVIFYEIDKVLPELHEKEIAFLNLNNPAYKPYLAYYLDYYHVGLDFPSDHVIFGQINNMYNAFNYYIPWNDPVPPESIILRNYLTTKGNTMFSYPNLINQGIYLFARDCNKHNSKIVWLKNNWDLISLTYNPAECFIF